MIRVTTDVFCDECGNWSTHGTSSKAEPASAREGARSRGWRTTRRDRRLVDLCPPCAHAAGLKEDPYAR